mmetsp:Transcript_9114/g.15965  ORF Transcript_9114/g.15965 Transcript_9114/m.15965 type:complete len:240 (-) Transcript_9114:51-770(-)
MASSFLLRSSETSMRCSALRSVSYQGSGVSVSSFLFRTGSSGSRIASSSSPSREGSSVLLVSDVEVSSCSLDLNMLVNHGSLSGAAPASEEEAAAVGLSVSSNGSASVGVMVGASVVTQMGSLPSINSGGWQLSNSGRHMHPIPDSAQSTSVSNAPQLQSVELSSSVIPIRFANSSSDKPSSFSSLAKILRNGGRAPYRDLSVILYMPSFFSRTSQAKYAVPVGPGGPMIFFRNMSRRC